MFEPVVSTIMTLATVSGNPIGEQLSFGTLYYAPPGPQITSVGHSLAANSIGANSAVIQFDYSQDGGPLGSALDDINLQIHLPDGQVIDLDPIPGAPSAPPFDTIRFESRRFFFEPVAQNGPWTVIASQDFQNRTDRVELANVRMLTDLRPEPVIFDRFRLNDGFVNDQFGAHPYGLISFRVDTTGEYEIQADWVNYRPGPGEGDSYFGNLYILEGYYGGDLSNLIASGRDIFPEPFRYQSLVEQVRLQAGETYTVMGQLLNADEDDRGYGGRITITGDGTAWQFPRMAPRPPRRLSR